MAYPYQILLPLLSLFWIRVDLTDLFPMKLHVQLVEIMDGDTLRLRSGGKTINVRLSKIDAPEMRQPFHGSKLDAGKFSKACLKNIMPERGLLTITGFDMYHRALGDYEGVNYKAIQLGCSGLYPHASFSSVSEKIRFLKGLIEAKKNRTGVWRRGGYILPKKWRKISKRSGSRLSH